MATQVRRFVTDAGIEVPAITTAQMREVDRVAIEVTGPNLHQMMENAGRNLAQATIELLGAGWREARVFALAGTGGNGGGAICAARHLANRAVAVSVALTDAGRLGPVPADQLAVYDGSGGTRQLLEELDQQRPDVILDGIIGYSLSGEPRGAARRMIDWANSRDCPVVSLDVPSGIDATSGAGAGVSIRPTMTISLALPKTGLHPRVTGELQLADIGIPRSVYRAVRIPYRPPFGAGYRVSLAPLDFGAALEGA